MENVTPLPDRRQPPGPTLQQQFNALKESNVALDKKVESLRADCDTASAALVEAQAEVARLTALNTRISEALEAEQGEVGKLMGERAARKVRDMAAKPELPVPVFDDYPEFNQSAMGCGLEDRGITDRYDAMRYGWDEAIERMGERIVNFLSDFGSRPAAGVQVAPTEECTERDCHYFSKVAPDHCRECNLGKATQAAPALSERAPSDESSEPLAKVIHERAALATAIRDAAVKSGVCRDDADLTGPLLIMLCGDMAECILLSGRVEAPSAGSVGDYVEFHTRLADIYAAHDESTERGISAPNEKAVEKLVAYLDRFIAGQSGKDGEPE